jgi:hypothetical protein
MELEITEIDNLSNYEEIPENMPPKISVPKINVVKQSQDQTVPNQNIKPFLSGPKAKITRPIVPPEKSKISYDDILNKMGMFVANGKLHLLDENGRSKPKKQVETLNQNQNQNHIQNSYIYNKYFQNDQYAQEQQQRPLTPLEYKNMLINNIIQKHRIKQMKSTKLIMPNSNINISSAGPRGDINKLFGFSQK